MLSSQTQERGSCQTADQNQARALLPISIRNRGISNLPHRALSNCDIYYQWCHSTWDPSLLLISSNSIHKQVTVVLRCPS